MELRVLRETTTFHVDKKDYYTGQITRVPQQIHNDVLQKWDDLLESWKDIPIVMRGSYEEGIGPAGSRPPGSEW